MKPFRGLLAGLLLALSTLSAQAQTQVAKGDSTAPTQSNRLQLGANATRMGQKASTGNFEEFAFKREVVAAAAGGVQSVNGKGPTSGNVQLVTSDIAENVNLYYTQARARQAISAPAGPVRYDNTTGVFSFSGTGADVGLGNVSNTSDANKPVSTFQQQALDLKANLATTVYSDAVNTRALLDNYTVPNGKAYLITVKSDEKYKKKDGSNSINTLYWKSVSADGATIVTYKLAVIDESN